MDTDHWFAVLTEVPVYILYWRRRNRAWHTPHWHRGQKHKGWMPLCLFGYITSKDWSDLCV